MIPNVSDVEIDATAYAYCEALAQASFLFTWHEDQPAANRDDWLDKLQGMPSASGRLQDQRGGSA